MYCTFDISAPLNLRLTPPFFNEFRLRYVEVVTRDSATLHIPGEDVVMMNNSDHQSMCRFNSLDDPRFSLVWKKIVKLSRRQSNIQGQLIKMRHLK